MNRTAEKMVDNNLSQRERVTIALQSFGEREIHFKVDDLAAMCKLPPSNVYQVLWRLQQRKEIEILTEPIGNTDRKRVCGAILHKLEPATEILEKIPERIEKNVSNPAAVKAQGKVKTLVPNLVRYMDQKLVIERVRQQLISANLAGDMVQFEENPYAEEGIYLLNEWINLSREKVEADAKIEAMSRELRVLKGQKYPVPEVGGEPVTNEETLVATEAS